MLEGEQVKQGQLLAVQDLGRFQYAVDSAEAKLEVQQQVLDRLIKGSQPEEIGEARAEVKGQEATVRFAKKELYRMQTLAKKNWHQPKQLIASEQSWIRHEKS